MNKTDSPVLARNVGNRMGYVHSQPQISVPNLTARPPRANVLSVTLYGPLYMVVNKELYLQNCNCLNC